LTQLPFFSRQSVKKLDTCIPFPFLLCSPKALESDSIDLLSFTRPRGDNDDPRISFLGVCDPRDCIPRASPPRDPAPLCNFNSISDTERRREGGFSRFELREILKSPGANNFFLLLCGSVE